MGASLSAASGGGPRAERELPDCMACGRRVVEVQGGVCPQCVLGRWRELDRAMRLQVPPEGAAEAAGVSAAEVRERLTPLLAQKRGMIARADRRWRAELRGLLRQNPGVPAAVWEGVVRGRPPAACD